MFSDIQYILKTRYWNCYCRDIAGSTRNADNTDVHFTWEVTIRKPTLAGESIKPCSVWGVILEGDRLVINTSTVLVGQWCGWQDADSNRMAVPFPLGGVKSWVQGSYAKGLCLFIFIWAEGGDGKEEEGKSEGRRINRYRTPDMRCLQSIPSPKYNQVRKGFRP